MTIEWDDLRRFKAYRVVNIRGVEGVMTADVHGSGESRHYVYWSEGYGDWLREDGTIYSIHDQDTQVTILGELKLPSQLTAEDLDGMVFKTKDGGAVGFAGDNGFSVNCDAVVNWTSSPCPEWRRNGGVTRHPHDMADMVSQEYAAHVEQQKNPPIEIKWQGECRDDDGTLLSAWCEVRGEKWRVNRLSVTKCALYRDFDRMTDLVNEAEAALWIQQYVKDRAAPT